MMSIIYQIPHTARYIPAVAVATANFNVGTGYYEIDETPVKLFDYRENSIYLLDRYTISANIPQEDFLDCLTDQLPSIDLRKSASRQAPENYNNAAKILQYSDDKSLSIWTKSNFGDDSLQVSFKGILDQNQNTVGRLTIKIYLSFDIYEMDDKYSAIANADILSLNVGQQPRGGI